MVLQVPPGLNFVHFQAKFTPDYSSLHSLDQNSCGLTLAGLYSEVSLARTLVPKFMACAQSVPSTLKQEATKPKNRTHNAKRIQSRPPGALETSPSRSLYITPDVHLCAHTQGIGTDDYYSLVSSLQLHHLLHRSSHTPCPFSLVKGFITKPL